jgi:hypothetical protein
MTEYPENPTPDPDKSTLSEEELALLHRVDERTEHINDSVDKALVKAEDNADDIDEIRGKVQRNTTVLGGITGGVGMIVMWGADKISRFM